MEQVFISHVAEDAADALRLADRLEASGIRTWCYERHQDSGSDYLNQVVDALEHSTVVVAVISPSAKRSADMDREITWAHRNRKPLIPLLKSLSHGDFEARFARWAMIMGSTITIPLPSDPSSYDALVDGLQRHGIHAVDAATPRASHPAPPARVEDRAAAPDKPQLHVYCIAPLSQEGRKRLREACHADGVLNRWVVTLQFHEPEHAMQPSAGGAAVVVVAPADDDRSDRALGVPGAEVVRVHPSAPFNDLPSAHWPVDAGQVYHPLHAGDLIRKAAIRGRHRPRLQLRCASSRRELEQYFALRFRVWDAEGFIPPKHRSETAGMELDYTDRTSVPVVAVDPHAGVVGCARLVLPLGDESALVPSINQILADRGDETLRRAFEYPHCLKHPFDLLESFPAFNAYYRELVRKGLRKGELSRVIVAPEWRGRGIAECLVDAVVALASHHRVHRLFLACHENRAPLYQRSYFRRLEGLQTDRFVNVNAPAVAMERAL